MLRRHWPAALLFLLLALALTNPLLLHLWNSVEDKQDALLNTWIMAWVGHASIVDPFNLYNTNIFYPYKDTLAFSELLIPQGLLALPDTLAAHNPIFGYNLVLLFMLWLDAFGMYLLVLDWTGRAEAGWVAGIIFAFNPFNLGNLAQLQLLSLGWLPLALLYLRRIVIGGPAARQGTIEWHEALRQTLVPSKSTLLLVLFLALQVLSSIYYGFIGGIVLVIFVLFFLVSGRRSRQSTLRAIGQLTVAVVLSGIVLAPFLLPYFSVQRQLGFQRTLAESEPFSASLKQFVEVAPQNVVYGWLLAPRPEKYIGGYPLDNLFPGVLAFLLAFVGLVKGRPREKWASLLLLALAFILALGPRLYLAPGQPTSLTLPYAWLYDLFSPLRALRAPVRFEAPIMLSLALLAGFGLSVVARGPKLNGRLIALGWAGLIALEYLSLPAAGVAAVPVADEIPAVYKWLAAQPPGVSVELPMMGADASGRLDLSKQYLSTYHWQQTPDGYSGFLPPGRGAIAYELGFFPSPRSISLLSALGVRDVVIHRDQLAPAQLLSLSTTPDETGTLPTVYQDDEATVLAVPPSLQLPGQLRETLYVPQPVAAGEPFTAYVIVTNSGWPYSTKPTDRLDWTASWSIGKEEQVSAGAPLVTSSASVIAVPLAAPSREGRWSLSLQAAPGPLGAFTLKQEVTVGQDGNTQIVIPARAELASPLASQYLAGAKIGVALRWLPLNKIDAYYSTSVRVVDAQGNKIVAVDRQPAVPTLEWVPDTIVKDAFELTLPADVKPGKYSVELLMYRAEPLTPVLLLDGDGRPQDKLILGEFEVK